MASFRLIISLRNRTSWRTVLSFYFALIDNSDSRYQQIIGDICVGKAEVEKQITFSEAISGKCPRRISWQSSAKPKNMRR